MKINKKTAMSKILSVFDFDGTLTYQDSFILFLYFLFRKKKFISHISHMILPIFYYLCHKITRDRLKEELIRNFLSELDVSYVCQEAEIFCERYWTKLMRPAGLLAIEKEINLGAKVTICSASPTILLKPFAKKLNINFIGTKLEINNSKLTGRITGYNCRRTQKIIQLEKVYGDLSKYHLRVWGDSQGDYELLSIAQSAYWQYFHKTTIVSKILDKYKAKFYYKTFIRNKF